MKSLRIFIVSFVLLALLALMFFYNSAVGGWLKNLKSFFAALFDSSFNYGVFQELKLENQSLKLEIEKLQGREVSPKFNHLVAETYSRYPFNDRNLIIINLGFADGVTTTMPVLASANVLLGRVSAVKRTQSEVETVFNPSWRSAVTVGEKRTKAVLVGGDPPYLDFIPKEAPVKAGDEIFNISSEYPLNLLIGTVLDLDVTPQNPWAKAKVKTPYNPEDLDKLLVVQNFP